MESPEETGRRLRAQLREAEERWDAAVEHVKAVRAACMRGPNIDGAGAGAALNIQNRMEALSQARHLEVARAVNVDELIERNRREEALSRKNALRKARKDAQYWEDSFFHLVDSLCEMQRRIKERKPGRRFATVLEIDNAIDSHSKASGPELVAARRQWPLTLHRVAREIGNATLPKHVSVGKPEASTNKVRFPDGFDLDDPADAEWLALYLLGWAARARKASSLDGGSP